MTELEQVNKIIGYLQERNWNTYTPDDLISAQGKLSVLQASIGRMAADALYEYELQEQNAKMKETDSYMNYRRSDCTDGEAKAEAKIYAQDATRKAIEAKYAYKTLAGVLDAMQAIVIACQVTIKQTGRELSNANYQRNQ